MAARKEKAPKAPETVYLVARPWRRTSRDLCLMAVGLELDPATMQGGALRRLINTGHVVGLVDGSPIRKSRRHMRRLVGHPAVKDLGRLKAAKAARAAAGGLRPIPSGGGEGSKKVAGDSAEEIAAKKEAARIRKNQVAKERRQAEKKAANAKPKKTRRGA